MYLWTVQEKSVIELLIKSKKYYPKIQKSKGYSEMKLTYPSLLESYNILNKSNYEGFIFGFSEINGGQAFNKIEDLYNYLYTNPAVAEGFNFWKSNYTILQIEVANNINIMPLDFNDVIKLSIGKSKDIPLIQALYPSQDIYTSIDAFNDDIRNVIIYMNEGVKNPYTKLKSFIEGHYPYLDLKNVVGVYSNINLSKSIDNDKIELFTLSKEALELKELIQES